MDTPDTHDGALRTLVAARYLGVPPWELEEHPQWAFWQEAALMALRAEQEGAEELAHRQLRQAEGFAPSRSSVLTASVSTLAMSKRR